MAGIAKYCVSGANKNNSNSKNKEAKKYAKILGYNYQSSKWYEKSYSVFDKEYKENVKKRDKKRSKKNKTLKKIKSLFSLDG